MPGLTGGIRSLVRVAHPLPSSLVAVTTAALTLVAGADASRAGMVGIAMALLQASIGADNDVHDAASDAIAKPTKPIPAGLVSPFAARNVARGALAGGLAMSLAFGAGPLLLAAIGVACGYAHTRWARGTAMDIVVFAAGFALVPPYAWLAGAGSLPPSPLVASFLAGTAGAGLGLANGYADLERDRGGGVGSMAGRLGPRSARWLITICLAVAVGGAMASLVGHGTTGPGTAGPGPAIAVVGSLLALGGLVLVWRPLGRRELGWEVAATGIGILAVGWFAAFAGGAS